MPYAFIAEADNFASTVAATVTLSQTYSAGDSVVVCCHHNNNPSSNSVTVTDGTNTYTPVTHSIETTSNTILWLFYCPNPAAGTFTLTMTVNSNTNWRAIAAFRYSGLANVAAQTTANQRQAAPGTGTDAVSSGNMTPTSQPAMVFGYMVNATDTVAPTAGTGYTDEGTPASWTPASMGASRMEDKRITATSAVAATFTHGTGTETFNTIGAIFTETAAGAAPVIAWVT